MNLAMPFFLRTWQVLSCLRAIDQETNCLQNILLVLMLLLFDMLHLIILTFHYFISLSVSHHLHRML